MSLLPATVVLSLLFLFLGCVGGGVPKSNQGPDEDQNMDSNGTSDDGTENNSTDSMDETPSVTTLTEYDCWQAENAIAGLKEKGAIEHEDYEYHGLQSFKGSMWCQLDAFQKSKPFFNKQKRST